MRIAVVDVGSNSTRMLICDVEQGTVTELERRNCVTRLATGVDGSGLLSAEGQSRVFEAVAAYRDEVDRQNCDVATAILTSAVRDAKNGAEFAGELQRRFEINPRIIDGDEEARLTFHGATSERPADDANLLVVDIGGGSTELVVGQGHRPRFHTSLDAGVVRQTERHLGNDPPSANDLAKLRIEIRELLEQQAPKDKLGKVDHAIGVAGTATTCAAIQQRLEPYDPEQVEGFVINLRQIESILERLAAVPVAKRQEIPGLHADRAPTSIAGVAILIEVLTWAEIKQITVSEHDILRGEALRCSEENSRTINVFQ